MIKNGDGNEGPDESYERFWCGSNDDYAPSVVEMAVMAALATIAVFSVVWLIDKIVTYLW